MTANAGYHSYATGDVLTAAQVQFNLQNQVIMYFATSGARTTALTGVVVEGMFSYIPGNGLEYYTGSAWTTVSSPGDITGVAAGIGISGGGTSGDVTITNSMATTIDAKGDLIVGTANDAFARVAVGTNNQTILADSTTSPGLKWAASPQSILGTTGDILYASAANTPAALAAGTSGYYLKSGGAGVAPSWAANASAMTLITRASFSGVADTGTTFDGVFSSTYKTYLIVIENMGAVTNSDDLYLRLRYAGPTTQAATYNWNNAIILSNGTTATAYQNPSNWWQINRNSADSGNPLSGEFWINRVGNASEKPNMWGSSASSSTEEAVNFTGQQTTARIYTGVILSSSSTNITGTVAIYGLAAA